MEEYTDVIIIIVTYNGRKVIGKCIDSILSQNFKKKFRILIVDNNSTDKTYEFIKTKYPEIKVIVNPENYGFGKANNIGIKLSESKYVVLLNQDSYVDKYWLRELVNSMETNQDVACCGAKEIPYDKHELYFVRISTDTNNQIWMGCGSAILRRKALIQAGLFDEFYFMYGEDIDLSFTLKLSGWRIILNENAKWHHQGHNRIISSNNDLRLFHSWRGRIYLLLKFGSFRQIIKFFIVNLNLIKSKQLETNKKTTNKISILISKENILRKINLIGKITMSILPEIFNILKSRHRMKKIIKNQSEVDSWIEYVNKQFRGS